jgi:hypothetical protein
LVQTLDDLQNLHHLLACFHEALRIYRAFSSLNAPIAFNHFFLPASSFGMIRELTEDIAITVGYTTGEATNSPPEGNTGRH